ncbi:hypothetical protein [Natrinema ejinorense]|uniref:Uncharacterized protein n=1 Tax=Natrinema ejinorense TaxID=373386 RepID=A0A2A5QXS4_9EURY|nr:hypothetical protein [Natrinema ejinorense]PCR91630.1 hypothetical protein CP557_14510 [Natrinema ejinorense]
MSAEQRGPDSSVVSDEPTRITPQNPTAGSSIRTRQPPHRPSGSEPREPPLSYRIERTRLRTRIAALEDALATSRTRRQAVVDQYERVLSDRDDSNDPSLASSDSRSRSLLARLLDR